GLKHFVTWESKQVRIWQCESDGPHQHQQFNLEQADHPDGFRHLLGELLETLKLLAVVGLVPANELSPCYLHNLFQITLDLALPPLVNSYRSQRATEELSRSADADQLAYEADRLLLLQLLGLLWHQQLQSAILPEKFELAVQFSLPQLPEPLRAALSLSVTAAPPPLPHEAAVCFHHLQLRLRQLAWRQPEQRAIAGIQQLIAGWYPTQRAPLPQADVLLYPQYPALCTTAQLILSDSPALLAAIGLQQDLLRQPPQELVLGNLFQLELNDRTDLSINGVLTHQRLLSTTERHQFATLLRTSWPNRRFRIGGDKPLWFWELIHLLGLAKNQQKLQLTLPRAALQSSPAEAFWPLLQENYSVQQVTPLEDELISLQLIPATRQEVPTNVVLAEETRPLPYTTELLLFRNQLLLALYLPAEIYRLLDDKLLWTDKEPLDKQAGAGMQIYMQSSLWQLFEQILGPPLPAAENATFEARGAWPRPDNLHLREINRASRAVGNEQQVDADRLLATLLQIPAIDCLEVPENKRKQTTPTRVSDKKLQQELVQQLLKEGIPTFPEQYLYFLEQPDMATYRLTPPLTVKRELLGEIELEDAAGQTLLVYGEELANALLLCSALGKTKVDLPLDRQQLALLQQHYWQDMSQLYKQLSSHCHSLLQNPKDAGKLTSKVWKKLKLPKLPKLPSY
ncbi:MAG: hypothetical protein GXP51_05620, partial [Deltaproteobacteria bacterium]|nr:hypothetical protein [Deltaproteobacteria bacterium]